MRSYISSFSSRLFWAVTVLGIPFFIACSPASTVTTETGGVIPYEGVANFTYDLHPLFEETVVLQNGAAINESALFNRVELTGHVGQGTYESGKPFAVPILEADAGHFGVFYLMCVVDSNKGSLRQRDCTILGDRVEVRRLEVDGSYAVLDIIGHAVNDSLGHPTDTTHKILYISRTGQLEDPGDSQGSIGS